ncbi:hypothetical protein RJ640_015588 [Escallonia rubra]|uniref:Protein FAR1-RELATED SEQUENCE n=1 Tax=Escallonia rubra TaxID=112253 RepID=A0AA88RLW6_9ASTE|nr:hypothetical protein RJ640_015588 [Escallonia rubra]
MTTNRLSESIHSYFDRFVNSSTMLNEFVVRYDEVIKSRRKAEKDENFMTINAKAVLATKQLIEAKAGECCTHNATCTFGKFETYEILCKHILYIMRKKKLLTLHEFYILPRWSINVEFCTRNLGLNAPETNFSKSGITPLILWSIQKKVNKVTDDGMDYPSEIRHLNECLDSFLAEQAIRKNANQLQNDESLS